MSNTAMYNMMTKLIDKSNVAVRTETQTLNEQQKTQARANIGALGTDYTPPTQTAEQVGADPKGTAAAAVAEHNVDPNAHEDIRSLIEGLSNRLNAIANSTDEDLDQIAELVEYIKDNRELIEQITTGKVSVSDIVDNLSTNVATKPLSAAQGVALKGMIDDTNTALANKPDLTATEIETLAAAIK